MLPVFKTIMEKLDPCNIQIFQSGHKIMYGNIDWFNVVHPIKIIQIYEMENRLEETQINVVKFGNLPEVPLHDWTNMVRKCYMFYTYNGYPRTLPWDNAIVMFIRTQANPERLHSVYFDGNLLHGNWNRIGVLFILAEKKFKVCYWHRKPHPGDISLGLYSDLSGGLLCDRTRGKLRRSVFKTIREIQAPPEEWCYGGAELNAIVGKRLSIGERLSNPFNPNFTSSKIMEHILKIIFLKANRTLIIQVSCTYAQKSFIRFKSSKKIESHKLSAFENFIVSEFIGYQYVTCSREKYMTFKFYITPFKPWLRGTLFISLILIIAITTTFNSLMGLSNTSFVPWLFIVATILEEEGHLPENVGRKWFIRLILGAWCLMSVIITNCYNGIMITELNAPLSALHLSNFHQLLCHREDKSYTENIVLAYHKYENTTAFKDLDVDLSKISYKRIAWYLHYIQFTSSPFKLENSNEMNEIVDRQRSRIVSNNCFHILSLPLDYTDSPVIYSKVPEFIDLLRHILLEIVAVSKFSKLHLLIYNLLDPKLTHYPKGFQHSNPYQAFSDLRDSVETELLDCGKTVFVAKSDIIRAEYQYLRKHYFAKKFYKSTQISEYFPFGLYFLETIASNVPKYFKDIFETGIYGRLKVEEARLKYLNRKPVKKFQDQQLFESLGLDGAIVTVFIICGITIIVAGIAFLFEVRSKIYTVMKIVTTSSRQIFSMSCSKSRAACTKRNYTKVSINSDSL
ncbi:hypothetical protein Fcan01_25293 [Folsomia candida]|uniref:Uncharacterized protein n=1 Tax=Folsomia candida TaxID=158441 RepID=A0A226D3Y8_FOLCA|nr:hypothetical protein Fcan01_25293 [Folsomia candida]